jgi:hypothetical protein
MLNTLTRVVSTVALALVTCTGFAQKDWKNVRSKEDISEDSISKNGFTLIFINKDPTFDKNAQQKVYEESAHDH